MELTEEQKIEISNYIVTVPKYRETYNELYDHILNALADNETSFSIEEVIKVVNNDFGGFSEIVYQEKIYEKELSNKYSKQFRQEMVNTFKWPGIFSNLGVLALCLLIYYSSKTHPFNIKPALAVIYVCFVGAGIFAYAKIMINRYKYSKFSILDNYIYLECMFFISMPSVFLSIAKGYIFEISDNGKLIVMLSLFFFCSIYVRTFIKFYKEKFKILSV